MKKAATNSVTNHIHNLCDSSETESDSSKFFENGANNQNTLFDM